MIRAVIVGVLVAGCAGSGGGGNPDAPGGVDGNPVSDAPLGCTAQVHFEPTMPTSGTGVTVRADGDAVGAIGFVTYTWDVRFGITQLPVTPVAPDSQDVTFPIEQPGIYDVRLEVTSDTFCQPYDSGLNVRAPGATDLTWRFRFVPGANIPAPPQEIIRVIPGGADFDLGTVVLDGGAPISTVVRDGAGAGVPAYLRFTSAANDALMIEAYADATGLVETHVPAAASHLLVVPSSPNLAPRYIASWLPGDPIVVDGGMVITGTVYGPTGAALSGAGVSLEVDGVPSTVDTTAPNGTYSVRVRPGAAVQVTVAPPDATGLPRLTATLGAPSSPIDVSYDPSVITRNLAGTVLKRAGTPAPGARVTFVGAVAGAGTASMGAASAPATGTVAIAAVAIGGGALPAPTRVAAVPLSAVVATTAADSAVVAVDLTGGAPAAINAPAMAPLTAHVIGPAAEAVAGARLTAIPTGALALGAMMPAFGQAATDGTVTLQLAPGGTYDLVIDDPHHLRARRWILGVSAGPLGDVSLEKALRIVGSLREPGGSVAARATSVEAFCPGCTGIDAQRPAAESATNLAGDFGLAVRDPGVALAPQVAR